VQNNLTQQLSGDIVFPKQEGGQFMRKLEITNAKKKQLIIQQEILRSEESRYDHRLHGVLMISRGMSCGDVARWLGQDTTTVERWVKRVNSDGCDGLIILDNARYHHASLLAPFLEQRQSFLRLDFLPPYSPDLNPIERVWKLLRKLATHNCYFATLEELTHAVTREMKRFEKPNPILVSLCGKN
jgi:transposase